MSAIEDQELKEKLNKSAEEYKEKLENDVYEILKDVEKILAGAAIGGTIALALYLLLNKSKSEDDSSDPEEDYPEDPPNEKASFLGSLGQVFFQKGKELVSIWLLTEAKKKLNEYLDNLNHIENNVTDEKS